MASMMHASQLSEILTSRVTATTKVLEPEGASGPARPLYEDDRAGKYKRAHSHERRPDNCKRRRHRERDDDGIIERPGPNTLERVPSCGEVEGVVHAGAA